MKKHTKIYMDHFSYGIEDFIKCELLGGRANDIHHIEARGLGGSKECDDIENLMAIDRELHIIYGDKKQHMDFLREAHRWFMKSGRPYAEINPYHTSFDVLEGHPLSSKVIHERNNMDEIYKYRV